MFNSKLSEEVRFIEIQKVKEVNISDIFKFIFTNKVIILGALLVGILIYLYYKFKKDKNYNYGEAEVEKILKTLPRKYKVINDLMLKTKNGTTQIDHLVICKKGIYVIETKALNGVLYGNEYSRNWTQVAKDKKVEIHNPIKQNEGHVRAIRSLMNHEGYNNVKYISVLSFADFTKLNLDVDGYNIVRFKNLDKFIKKYSRKNLSKKEVREIYKILNDNNINSSRERKKHIQRIEENKSEYEKNINKKVCPVCKNKLKKKRIKGRKYLVCKNCNFKDII